MENEENKSLEEKLIEHFQYSRWDDVYFDKVTVHGVKVNEGKAVGIYYRSYETYSPGRDTDYSGIVYTDGKNFSRLLYNKVLDTSTPAGQDPFTDKENYISEIVNFDGKKVIYKTKSGNEKELKLN